MSEKKSKYIELLPFTVENINNGDLVNQINLSIDRVTADMKARPLVRKAREIVVKIAIVPPVADDPQQVAEFGYLVSEKIPAHRGFKGTAALRDGALQLHEYPTENVNQQVLPFAKPAATN